MFNPIRTVFNLVFLSLLLTALSYTHLKAFEMGFKTGSEPSMQNTALRFVLSNLGGK
jgi:hypothetical protein